MPRASHTATIARQWELLRLLPSRRPGRTAGDLWQELVDEKGFTELTKRTVERDLDSLANLFPIICNDKSKPYGWYWTKYADGLFPSMDVAEAVSLGMLRDVLAQLVPSGLYEALEGRFERADAKLEALAGNSFAEWRDLVRYIPSGIPYRPPEVSGEVIEAVQDALLRQRRIKVAYRKAGATEPKEQVLHPLALIQQGVRSYLIASAFDFDKPIHYAVHRIEAVEVLDEPARRPKGFSLDRYLAEGGGLFGGSSKTKLKLKARLDEKLATILRETPISEDQKITTRKGVHTLTASVFDSWQLEFWILSSSCLIEVREPKSLRKKISSRLDQALGQYRSATESP